MRLFKAFLILTLVFNLSACTKIETLRKLKFQGNEFHKALAHYYHHFAEQEAAQYDWIDSQRFIEKAYKSAMGKTTYPEDLRRWRLPPTMLPIFQKARKDLLHVLNNHHLVESHPHLAAKAQFSFDCWVEEQEENWQNHSIDGCREEFYSSLKELHNLHGNFKEHKSHKNDKATHHKHGEKNKKPVNKSDDKASHDEHKTKHKTKEHDSKKHVAPAHKNKKHDPAILDSEKHVAHDANNDKTHLKKEDDKASIAASNKKNILERAEAKKVGTTTHATKKSKLAPIAPSALDVAPAYSAKEAAASPSSATAKTVFVKKYYQMVNTSAKLTDEQSKFVTEIANTIHNNNDYEINITAYSRQKPSEAENFKVAQNLASAVKQALIKNNVPADKIMSFAYGQYSSDLLPTDHSNDTADKTINIVIGD